MNLINAAESIVKAKADEFAFVMNTCVQDQQSENLEKFLNALSCYQKAVSEYEILQGLKQQVNEQAQTKDETDTSTDED